MAKSAIKMMVATTVTLLRKTYYNYQIKYKKVCLHFSDESSQLADDFSQGPWILLPVDAQIVGQTCQKDVHKWRVGLSQTVWLPADWIDIFKSSRKPVAGL